MQQPIDNANKPIIGISACVAGQEVRYNASHKRSKYCMDTLSAYFRYRPFCPEVAIGLPVPRPAIRIVERDNQLTLVETHEPKDDHAPAIEAYAAKVAVSMRDASGFIFMQKSPTCGLGSAKVYGIKGGPLRSDDGLFVRALRKHLPLLPITEAGRLNDAKLREHFFAQVYAYHEWQTEIMPNLSVRQLTDFHYRYKMTLRAHDQVILRQLGKLLADPHNVSLEELAQRYIEDFMRALSKVIGVKHHAYAMTRMVHYMKRWMTTDERQYADQLIEQYKQGSIPLVAPMSTLRFFMQKYQCAKRLAVWEPYPQELGLQNAI
ncbi:YbgA family protein [Pseudobowmanella zhangzhouensis]|uniref:YbgA family protein n=1 Tax=Pseudobowmanella zhangzhouensis TaxID=1537679 RepID=UPI003610245E